MILRFIEVQNSSVALSDEGVLLEIDFQNSFHYHERKAAQQGPLELRRNLEIEMGIFFRKSWESVSNEIKHQLQNAIRHILGNLKLW